MASYFLIIHLVVPDVNGKKSKDFTGLQICALTVYITFHFFRIYRQVITLDNSFRKIPAL